MKDYKNIKAAPPEWFDKAMIGAAFAVWFFGFMFFLMVI